MAENTPRYRFRGSVAPCAEVKRPVKAYRNAESTDATGTKSTTATVDIFDVIDSWGGWWGISAGEVDQALAGLGDGVTTLYVRINSPGGEATEGIAIANLLRAHAATIHVTNYGLAASAASVIAIAGDTLAMAPGSLLMIHKAWNFTRGNADDMRDEAAILDKFDESLAGMYALKAGADTDWLALMGAETWMTPEDAVAAGLADTVGIESGPPPVNPDDQAEPLPDVEGDTPFDRASKVFDLTVFEHAPAAFAAAPKTPAEPPEQHPTNEEAVTLTPDQIKALRERLGLGDDADTAAINAKLDELEEAATKPDGEPAITDEAIAAHFGVDAEKIKTAIDAAKDDKGDKIVMSKVAFEELQANSKLGVAARQQQLEEARDTAIKAAVADGKISRDRVEAWTKAWDADPEGVKADLGKLEARFPVAGASGYAGSDGTDGDGTTQHDAAAAEAEARWGIPKEALTNG